jgi:predicted class III extradiol MEMO1 family dioxygenase
MAAIQCNATPKLIICRLTKSKITQQDNFADNRDCAVRVQQLMVHFALHVLIVKIIMMFTNHWVDMPWSRADLLYRLFKCSSSSTVAVLHSEANQQLRPALLIYFTQA